MTMTNFTPDPKRVEGLTENTDRDTLTEGTQELFRERSAVEKIIEYYGLLAININNVQAWDRMSVGKYDIYTREEDPNERTLIVAKEDQRGVLERYCRSIGLGIITDKSDIGLRIIPNPPDKKVPQKTTNLLGLPVDQFKDKAQNHATTGSTAPDEGTSQTPVTDANSGTDGNVNGSEAQGAGASKSNQESDSTNGTGSNEGEAILSKTDAGLSKADSTAGNDGSEGGATAAGTTVKIEEIDPKVKNARDNYLGAVGSEVPVNKKNDIAWMEAKTKEALGL